MLGRREPESTPADEIRRLRVEAARRNSKWKEIEPPIRRGRWLVDAASDELHTLHRGVIWHRAQIEFGADQPLRFFVDAAGHVIVLDRVLSPRTWSEFYERQTRRRAGAGTR